MLFIGPRPGKKSYATLDGLGLTHCVTLLSEREDVAPIRRICDRLGCTWVWLPYDGGHLDILKRTDLAAHIAALGEAIADEAEPRLYLHCSAGIHRTGFFAHVLLRLSGFSADGADAELARIRPVTAEQVGADRIALAEEMVAQLSGKA